MKIACPPSPVGSKVGYVSKLLRVATTSLFCSTALGCGRKPVEVVSMPILQVTHHDAPAAVRSLHQRRCVFNHTMGDGACAIHSVFGEAHDGGFKRANARQFLRNTLGETADVFTARVGDVAIVSELVDVLWQELIQPCAAKKVGLRIEARLVWDEITRTNPPLAQLCVEVAASEQRTYEEFMVVRGNAISEFAMLCIPSLEQSFVRPLLVHLDLLEEYEREQAEGCDAAVSKLKALFTPGAHRKRLLQGVVERCGVSNFDSLHAMVVDIVGGMDLEQLG